MSHGRRGDLSEMQRRMLAGELYIADDPVLQRALADAQALTGRYNATEVTPPR